MSGTAVITGGSRGIGRAIGVRLAREGYDVILAARGARELDAACEEITRAGGRARPLVMDLRDPASVAGALRDVEADVLVNNAGIGVLKPLVELEPDDWARMIDVNVNALFHVTRALLPGMLARRRGHVCTIGSISGRSAFAGGSAYAATKAFVTAWAESRLMEVRDQGVKVSVVTPGSVATGFGGKAFVPAGGTSLAAEDVADAVAYVLGTPDMVLVHRLEVRTRSTKPRGS
jgi:NADP-dependent 3-hydroxy acid dehydrogenase YdfG